jgi:hypothetical protein
VVSEFLHSLGSWWIVQILSTDTPNSLICASFLGVRRK